MKNKTLIIIVVIVILLVAVKLLFLQKENTPVAGPGAKSKSGPATVIAYVTKSSVISNNIYSSGTVLANEEAALRPETAGKIISINFKEGTFVRKGQLLVKINDADLQAQLKKSTLNYSLAKQKEERIKGLLDIKGVSQEEYDVAFNQLQTIEADIDFTKAQIAKTEIRAPFDGIVGLKNISEGGYVNTTDVIATMQQTDPVKVDFSLPEKYSGIINIEDTVTVSLEGGGHLYTGEIYAIDPKIDQNTRSLKVRALVENKKHTIFPGSFAQVIISTESKNAVVVPSMAVIPDLRGEKTFLIHKGKADLVLISTGTRTDTTVEVLKGVNAGDTVITTGIMGLKPGTPVKIQSLKK